MDEEQEFSYKQENPAPRYNARDVALIRGKQSRSVVLLTSATPCLESYYNAIQKKITLLKLTKRFGNSTYPDVMLVDMKKESFNNKYSVLSTELIQAIKNRLQKSEQVILLQNRRGYSLVQQCFNCGTIKMCANCSVSLTFHQTDNNLHCHYCKNIEQIKSNCHKCNSEKFIFAGFGTQRIEDVLHQQFPNSNILRMDMDVLNKKHSHEIL